MSGQDLERLALGEPAATLWRECRAALREAFDALPGGPREWRFGGGTILAARWGHRTSFDIDLTVAPEMDVDALLEPEGNAIQTLAARLGGSLEPSIRNPAAHLKVRFAKHPALKDSALDITRLQPEPAGRQRPALVDGTETLVLDSAQILRGKLERAERSPVRDVFDVATADQSDPGALAIAANCLTHQYASVIAEIWRLSRRRFADDAGRFLVGVPDRFRIEPEAFGERAARALGDALYRSVRIRAEDGFGTVEATTGGGHVNRFAFEAADFESGLRSCGMAAYLRMNARSGHALRKDFPRRIRESAGAPTLLWEGSGARPGGAGPDAGAGRRPGP